MYNVYNLYMQHPCWYNKHNLLSWTDDDPSLGSKLVAI